MRPFPLGKQGCPHDVGFGQHLRDPIGETASHPWKATCIELDHPVLDDPATEVEVALRLQITPSRLDAGAQYLDDEVGRAPNLLLHDAEPVGENHGDVRGDVVLTLLLPEHTGLGQNLATERAHRGAERDDDPCDRLLVPARRSPRLEENPSHQLVACVPFVRQAIEITRPQPSIEHGRSLGHAGAHIMRWPHGQHARRIGSGRDGRSRSPSFTRLPGGVCSSA